MRRFSILLIMFCMASAGWGQTITNGYVPKAADMRIVEGKMYNRELATNWVTLPAPGGTLEVVEVLKDGLMVKNNPKGEKVVIKHHTDEKGLAKGKTIIAAFRAMRVGDVKYGTETVAVYDCGLANTRENRKTLKQGEIRAGP